MKLKGNGNGDAGPKIVAKRAPKNARKNDKKSNNVMISMEAMGEMGACRIFLVLDFPFDV